MSPPERTARLAAIRSQADAVEGWNGQIVDDLIDEEIPWLLDEVERMAKALGEVGDPSNWAQFEYGAQEMASGPCHDWAGQAAPWVVAQLATLT